MNYQLIAFDMDDTLLDSNRIISPENRYALLELHKLGIKIVLCSGRPSISLLGIARELFADTADEYIIGFNGAAIVSVSDAEELSSMPVPESAGLRILDTARRCGILLQAYQGKRFYTERDDARARAYSQSVGMPLEIVADLGAVIRSGSLKLLMNAPHNDLLPIQQQLQQFADNGEFHMVFSKPDYLEIVHPEVNKGAGLRKLCHMLGIEMSAAIAVGDSSNDREMIEAAGTGIAVANARPEIKAIADIVLDSDHNQAIVTEIIKKLGLL
ncbi:Cof-type HAD-IIB family hydrolase [Spirochaeta dissipatitropha]